jgi:hypothetical protein
MTGSADTASTHAVSAICGYAVGTDTVSTVCSYAVGTHTVSTICSYAVGTHTVSTICSYAVRTNTISTICSYAVCTDTISTVGSYAVRTDTISTVCSYTVRTDTISTVGSYAVRTDTISTVCGYAVRASAVGTIFNDAEALQGTLVATFGNAVGADTICAIFSDDRGSGLFGGNLRQGESAGRQGGDNEAGEDLLFHGRSPKEGVSNWLRGPCYARPKTAKGTSRDSDNQCHRYLEKPLSIRQIVSTTDLSASPSPSVYSTALRVNGTGICIKNQ